MRPRQVRSWDDVFDFQEFCEELRSCSEGTNRLLIIIEIQDGEHLAANGLVPDPKDQVRSPLHGLCHVWELPEVAACAFDIHGFQPFMASSIAQKRAISSSVL